AQADSSGRVVPLHHGDLDEVATRVGHDAPFLHGRLDCQGARQELSRHDPHDANLPGPGWDPKRSGADWREADRLPHPIRNLDLPDLWLEAALQDLPRAKRLEVVEDEDVGPVPRCDRAEAPARVV